MSAPPPWFKLPEEDEKALEQLVLQYGVGRVLAVLSRFQVSIDKQAREDGAQLRPKSFEEMGL